ncbi:MAG: sensor domain-containing diguanylate cyclase [Rhodospirillaceae bacterium]|jgi:diguanylate cyclase (GGDEF)-like protein|nr:sensor domain-containing diguanylate cyclase [Rhodospirillaceae bacterium]
MLPAPIPENDDERLASLESMNLLSTPREADIDRITRTAQFALGTEIALVSLVDKDRQWFKSRCGLDATETPRDISFCGHAIHGDDVFVVKDATKDERFHDNPLVTGDPHVRFYAGHPLKNSEGHCIGSFCVISPDAREFSDEQCQTLQDLGRMVEIVLDNRKLSDTQSALLESLVAAKRDRMIDPLTGLWNRGGFDDLFQREIARAQRDQTPLGVVMADIDHFKRINDTYGHPVGDEAIKMAASLLLESARTSDVVARYGGEEFAIIAPGIAPAYLPTLGDKILRRFRTGAKLATPDGSYAFTLSIGLTIRMPGKNDPDDMRTLLEHADQALYAAKEGGRDRFEISGADESLYSEFALA